MKKRRTALILSFIYCGVGQLYKGQIAKGIDFIFIYTLLIVSVIFSRFSPLLHILSIFVTLLVWLIGMMDAHIDYKRLKRRRRHRRRRKLLTVLLPAVIFVAVVTLAVIQMQILHPESKPPASRNPRIWSRAVSRQSDGASTAAILPPLGNDVSYRPEENDTYEPNPYGNDVIITAYSLKPSAAKTGTTIAVNYTIKASRRAIVALGCSIQKVGATIWTNDSDNDRVINLDVGSASYSRKFTLPTELRPGKYNVAWGIWDSQFHLPYDGRLSRNALTVESTSAARR